MNIDQLLERLPGVCKTASGYEARCTAHDDGKASLGISTGTDGRILLHCHAGCSTEAVVSALGLKMADLFHDKVNLAVARRLVATYDYTDEAGALLFQVVRYEPKDFRQRRPDPAKPGGWLWSLKDTRRVLYRLPEVIVAVKAKRWIVIVEGEKDAEALAKAGFVATCNPMGAGKWLPEHTETLRAAARVVVIADKDARGRKHAAEVADALRAVVGHVCVLELPDRAGRAVKDAADWLGAGGTADELKALTKTAPVFVPVPTPVAVLLAPEGKTATDETALRRLAALTALDFDRCADEEAKTLGVNVGTLRSEVTKRRKQTTESGSAAYPWQTTPEPWPDPVDGRQLLNDLQTEFVRYLVLPPAAATALALWVVHTYCFQLGRVSAYVALLSPEKRCGKTTALSITAALAHRALSASNIAPAALFRVIERDGPTLLIDEADSFVGDNEELRGILNAGFTRETAFVLRCVGDDHEPKPFRVFGPKLFAGIGKLPGTLADRSIIIPMRRKLRGEKVERFRGLDGEELRRQCVRWVGDNGAALESADPAIPEVLNDRAADLWRPLLATADLAGGDWPDVARAAALKLSSETEDDSQAVKLLASSRDYFGQHGVERVLTRDLIEHLNGQEEEPWKSFNRGNGINARQLGDRLKSFGVASRDLRTGEGRGKGYFAEDFRDACERYLPRQGDSIRDSVTTPANTGENHDIPSVTHTKFVTAEKSHCEAVNIGLSRCHANQPPGSRESLEEAMLL